MTKKYKQLNLAQRYKIEAYLSSEKSQTEIADLLCVHKSTISTELRRSIPKCGPGAKTYVAVKAQSKTYQRHVEKCKQIINSN